MIHFFFPEFVHVRPTSSEDEKLEMAVEETQTSSRYDDHKQEAVINKLIINEDEDPTCRLGDRQERAWRMCCLYICEIWVIRR